MHFESDLLVSCSQSFLRDADNVWDDWQFDDEWILRGGMVGGMSLEGFDFQDCHLFDSPGSARLGAEVSAEEDTAISVESQQKRATGEHECGRFSQGGSMNGDSERAEGQSVPGSGIKPADLSSPGLGIARNPPPAGAEDVQKMESVSASPLEEPRSLPKHGTGISSPCNAAESPPSNDGIPGCFSTVNFSSLESPSALSPPSQLAASTVGPPADPLQIALVNGFLSCEYAGIPDLGNSGSAPVNRVPDASSDARIAVEELFLDEKRGNYVGRLSQIGNCLSIQAMDQSISVPRVSEESLYPLFSCMYSSIQGHPIPCSRGRIPDLQGANMKPVITPMREVYSPRDIKPIGGYGSVSSLETDPCSALDETGFKIRKYTVEERKQRIHRYRNKRTKRNFDKKIKYACRKTLADGRSRVRGRFAKNEDAGEMDSKANPHPDEEEEEEV